MAGHERGREGDPVFIVEGQIVAERPDVLSFLSDPLDADLVVVGRLRARLFVSTDAPDTDVTAMLLDVRPDGYRANVADGIVRLRYRDGKSGYLKMLPLFYRYLLDVLPRYPEFDDFRHILEQDECAP